MEVSNERHRQPQCKGGAQHESASSTARTFGERRDAEASKRKPGPRDRQSEGGSLGRLRLLQAWEADLETAFTKSRQQQRNRAIRPCGGRFGRAEHASNIGRQSLRHGHCGYLLAAVVREDVVQVERCCYPLEVDTSSRDNDGKEAQEDALKQWRRVYFREVYELVESKGHYATNGIKLLLIKQWHCRANEPNFARQIQNHDCYDVIGESIIALVQA